MPSQNYTLIGWEDAPSTNTPISAENLNHMDAGIGALYRDVGDLEEEVAALDIPSTTINTILGDFATLETTTTASQNYAVGDHLVYNNILYKVTAAIASGGTISVGTNVTQTTVSAELKALELNFPVVNNLTTTEEGYVLDARQGAVLNTIINNRVDTILGDFAPIEPTGIASQSYSPGQYLILGKLLYKVTNVGIGTGDTLTPGDNIEQTTVGDQFREISEEFSHRQIKSMHISGTTNAYGNLDISTDVVSQLTGVVIGVSTTENYKAVVLGVDDASLKWVLRFYNYATTNMDSVVNTQVGCTIYYIEW